MIILKILLPDKENGGGIQLSVYMFAIRLGYINMSGYIIGIFNKDWKQSKSFI